MPTLANREMPHFLIRPRADKISRIDRRQLQRLLVYLGGIRTTAGFAFPSPARRQAAWEVLTMRFDARYFETEDQLVTVVDQPA